MIFIKRRRKFFIPVHLLLLFGSTMLPAGFQPSIQADDSGSKTSSIPWHDVRNYGSLTAAIAAIGSYPGTILIPDRQLINTNLTILPNITLNFLQGGGLAVANGAVVTLNGHIQAGPYKIFHLNGRGRVNFGPGSVGEAPVEWWGALGDDRTDNVSAFTEAIASVNENYGNPALILGPGYYRIGGAVTINKNNLTLRGVGHRISKLKCTAPGAGLVLDKGGKNIVYTTRLEELDVDGNNQARLGIDLVNTSETTFRGVGVRGCLIGLRLGGTVSPSQCTFTECVVADSGIGVKLTNAANPIFDKGNFWNNMTVFDFDTTYSPVFTNNWIEKFTTCFLFSHLKSKGAGVTAPTVIIRNNYLLSTDGGRAHEGRVFKFVGDNGSHGSNAGPIVFEGNHLYLMAAKYIAEINWGEIFAAGNKLQLIMKDNHLSGGINTKAWFKTDVASDSHRSHARLIFQDNYYSSPVAVQEGSGGLLTGMGALDPDWGTANRILGAFIYAPPVTFPNNGKAPSVKMGNVFKTANTSPTTLSAFADGIAGQKIMVIIGDSKTTIGFRGTSLKGNSGRDWKPSEGDWMECLFDGTRWYCSVEKSAP